MNIEAAVRQFMAAVGQETEDGFTTGLSKYKDLRLALIDEEFTEVVEAINWGEPVQIAKELADLVYVVVGTAIAFGIPFNLVFSALQNSNMSKLDSDGRVIKRADGKILKGPNYVEAETAIKEILG